MRTAWEIYSIVINAKMQNVLKNMRFKKKKKKLKLFFSIVDAYVMLFLSDFIPDL